MKNPFSFFVAIILVFISCKKEISAPADNQRPVTTDSTGNGLLMKSVEVWNSQDSLITVYEYDADSNLILATSLSGWGYARYYRDALGRINQIEKKNNTADTAYTAVFYADNSGKVSYTIGSSTAANGIRDSTAYFYTGEKVTKTELYVVNGNSFVHNSYNEWAYNAGGNLSSLKIFARNPDGQFIPTISYDFEYDDRINPFFSHDDARIVENWYTVASPNNLVKQINHYDGSGMPDDYITLVYEYDSGNKPYRGLRSGPAIGTSTVQSTFFYQ